MNFEAAAQIVKTWLLLDIGALGRVELDCPEAAYKFDQNVGEFEDVYSGTQSHSVCVFTVAQGGQNANLHIFRSVADAAAQHDSYIMRGGYLNAPWEERLVHMSPINEPLPGIPSGLDLRVWIEAAYDLLSAL